MWRSHEFRSRLIRGGFVAIIALCALTACQGGADESLGKTPTQDPSVIPTTVGNMTLKLDQSSLKADGSSFATATATLTDARGIARFGWPVRFFADLGDITWIWSAPSTDGGATTELFPTSCLIRTNSQGRAQCVLRSGFTRGDTFVNAAAQSSISGGFSLLSTSAPLTLIPQENEARGVSIAFIGDSCAVPEDTHTDPIQHRVEVQITRASDDPLGEGYPLENVRVYFDATRGHWNRTLGRFDSDVSDAAGLAWQTLILEPEDMGKTVTVVVFVNGSLPQSCSFVPGETLSELVQMTLDVQPGSVQAIPLDQRFRVTATVTTPGRLEQGERNIRFNSPVGEFDDPIETTDDDGVAITTLFIEADTAEELLNSQTITITAIDQKSGVVADVDLTVGAISSEITMTLTAMPSTMSSTEPCTAVGLRATVLQNGAAAVGRQVRLQVSAPTCSGGSLVETTTNSLGNADFTVVYASGSMEPGTAFGPVALDVASLVTATTTITVVAESDVTVVASVSPNSLVKDELAPDPPGCDPIFGPFQATISAQVLVAGAVEPGRTVNFSASGGTLESSSGVTGATGIASTGLCFPDSAAVGTYTVAAVDAQSGVPGSADLTITVATVAITATATPQSMAQGSLPATCTGLNGTVTLEAIVTVNGGPPASARTVSFSILAPPPGSIVNDPTVTTVPPSGLASTVVCFDNTTSATAYTLKAVDQASGQSATATFTVNP